MIFTNVSILLTFYITQKIEYIFIKKSQDKKLTWKKEKNQYTDSELILLFQYEEMEKKLTQGANSNYQLVVTFTTAEKLEHKSHVLEHFAKDMNIPGFRAGHAPLPMVEKKVDPAYLDMALNEHLINKAMHDMLHENTEIKFIGEPYGFDTKTEGDMTTITFSLDVYPEVAVKGKKWESVKMDAIEAVAEEKEVEESLLNIQKNYADYKDAETIELNTIAKLGLEFFDQDGKSLEKGTTYLGETEFNEDKFWAKTFKGAKKSDPIELKYDEKKLPEVLKSKKGGAVKLVVTVQDVKEIVLPELNDEMIVKLFGKDAEVKTNAELREYIKKEIIKQKLESGLVNTVEKYINDVRASGVSIIIPKTMVDQEVGVRVQNLEKRMGSAEKVQEYFKQLGEEKAREFLDGIKTAAQESLEKFFILNEVTKLLGMEIDWQNEQEPLFVEKQLYTKLVGDLPNGESTPKKSTKKTTAKAKKSEE